MQEARSDRVHLAWEVGWSGHHHRDRDPRRLRRYRSHAIGDGISRVVHHDEETVRWVGLPKDRSDVVVKSWVDAADRENHDRGREEPTEGQSHPAAHMSPQPEPLRERHPVRDEPQDGKDGEKQPEEIGGPAIVEPEGKVKLDRSRVRSASPHAPTRTSSPSRRASYLLGLAAGLPVFAPVLTSYPHPCIGQVTMGPSSSPSPTGPPRCKHTLETAKNRPSTLNKATGYPCTTTTRPLPGGISPAFATRTNTVIPSAEPSPSFEGCESLSRLDRMERRGSPLRAEKKRKSSSPAKRSSSVVKGWC